MRGPASWEASIAAQRDADIAVVVRTPGDDTAVPGKLYEALALGTPILALTGPDSALARMLARVGHDRGVAPHDDPAAIAAALERLLSDRPEPVPLETLAPYDRARIAERVRDLLDELRVGGRRGAQPGEPGGRDAPALELGVDVDVLRRVRGEQQRANGAGVEVERGSRGR